MAGPDGALAPLTPGSPQAALDAGIGMVHQHFALAESLTVLENVVLGTRPLGSLRLDLAGARKKLVALMADSGLDVPPDRRVSRLSRRREAAARNPESALSRRAHPRARRADRGAHPAGGRRPVRGAAPARRERSLDHLHLAQDERGAGDRRPHRGAARRRARSPTAPPRAPTARRSPN